MTRMFRSTLAVTLTLGALSLGATTARAQTGNGNGNGNGGQTATQTESRLNFTGSANLSNQPGSNGENLLIDFLSGNPPVVGGSPSGNVRAVPTVSGSFMPGISLGMVGSIRDLVVSSTGIMGTPVNTGLPINTFVSFGDYSFSLNSATTGNTFGPISLFEISTGTLATFGVTGFANGGGLMNQLYSGVFTAQFAGKSPADVLNAINTNNGALPVSFSAEFVLGPTNVVPEPSTYALMATGIAGLGFMARRRRSNGSLSLTA